jgi:hypothetical protein
MRGDTWPSSFALGHECEYVMLRLGQPVERVPAAPASDERPATSASTTVTLEVLNLRVADFPG